MATDKEIITQFLGVMAAEIKARIPRVTGKTADSVQIVATEHDGQIFADASIVTLEMGRRPTSAGGKKNAKTLREVILEWLNNKGINPREDTMTRKTLAFLIARSIHRKGTLLYRAGGFSGVITDSFSEARLTSIAEAFAGKYHVIVASKAFESYASNTSFKL